MFRRRVIGSINISNKVDMTCGSKTYNGETQVATNITVTFKGNTLTEGVDYIVTENNGGVNVGSYVVKIKGIKKYSGEEQGTFSITKVTPTVTAPIPINNLVYNASAQALINAGSTNFGTLKYSLDNSTYSTSIPSGTNATSYTIYYKVDGDSNVNNVAAQSISNSIAKVTPTVTAPTPKVLTYNGSAQELINAGSTNYGTMQYKVGSDSWSTSIPTRTRGGAYTVYYKVVGDSNINDVASASTQCSINEKPVTAVVTVSPSSYTYSGSYCEPTVTVNDGETVIDPSEYTVVYSNNLNAGTATVTIYDVVGGDYYVTGSTTFEITKQTPVLATSPTSTSPTYNGSAQDLLTGGSMKHSSSVSTAVPGTFTYDKGTNAGSYSNPKWYFTPTDTTNYNSTSGTVTTTTTISCSSSYTITAPTAKTGLVYNGSSQTLYNAGSSATVSGSFGYTGGTMTNAGSQTVSWVFTPSSANYCAKNGSFTGSIAQKAISIPTPTGVSRAYNGNAATATFPSATGAGITKYRYSTNGSSWTESTTNPSQTNAGTLYTQAYYKANDANYSGEGWTNTATIAISKADQSAPTATGATVYYHNTATATASGGGGVGTLTWTNGNTRSATGSQDTYAYWAGNSNYNASPNSNKVTLTVNKATDQSVTVTLTNRTYNTSGQVVATATSHGISNYYLGFGSSSTSAPTSWGAANSSISQTNAGTYYVWYKGTADANHSADISATYKGTVTIGKADQAAPTATGATTTYHNTATATASGGGGQGTLTWTNGNTRSATGSQDTYAYWAGNSNYNASPNSNKVTLTVNKATDQSVTVTLTNRTYNTSSQVVASATSHGISNYYLGFGSSSTSAPSSWGSANSSISQTNAGTYYVWYKGTADGNHSVDIGATYKGTVTIGKADQSAPTATGATTTYNTTATATASGGGGQGSIEWSNGNTQTSVGSKTTKARWSGNSNYNASPYSNEVTVKMNKADQSAPTATVTTATYPGTSTASASGGGGQGTLTWTNGSTRTAIGTATTKAYWAGNGNYNASPQSNAVTLSVAKFTPTVTLAATNRAYNGNALYATASVATPSGGKTMKGTIYYGTSAGATTYSVSYGGSGSVNLSSVSVTNVGSATVYAYFAPDSTCNDVYNNSGNVSKTFSVSKANQSAPTATGATTTYHNTATATASGGGGQGTLTWTNGNTRSATGSQDTYAYWAGNSNYNASPNSNKVTLTVNKATDQSVTVTLTNRTYNTSSQVVASATSHGCTYYLGFGSSSTSAPSSWTNGSISQTNAGTYYVWYKGTADANHSADISATYKGSVTIGKANQSAPTATGATSTYPTGATATASGGGGVGTLTWTNGSSRSTCGSQNTKAYWAGNSNYNASPESNQVTITVNKGTCPSYTAPTAKTGLVYNGSSQTLYNAGSSSNGSFSYSNGTRTDAGSQTVSWTFTPTDSCRNGASGSFTGSIACKSCTAPTAKSLTYNGSNQALVNAGSTSYGTMVYSTNNSSWSTTIPTGNAAGSYTVYWKVTGNTNVCCTASSSVAVTISKATGSVTVTGKNLDSTGSAQALVSVSNQNTGTIHYRVGTSGSWNTSIPTATAAGTYTVYYYSEASTNYTAVGSSSSPKSVTSTIGVYSINGPSSITLANGQYHGNYGFMSSNNGTYSPVTVSCGPNLSASVAQSSGTNGMVSFTWSGDSYSSSYITLTQTASGKTLITYIHK